MNRRFTELILRFTGTQSIVDAHQYNVLQRNNFIHFFAQASTFSLMMLATLMGVSGNIEQKMKSDAWYMLAHFALMWHSLIAFFIVIDNDKNRSSMESLSKATITATTAAAAVTLASSETNPVCNNKALFMGLVTAPALTMAYSAQTADSTGRVLTDVVKHSLEAVTATAIVDMLLPQRNTCKL